MKLSLLLSALLTPYIVSSSPLLTKRDSEINDVKIFNYALTLEHLENSFYLQGLTNYTREDFERAGKAANIFQDRAHFYDNLCEISNDEQAHVDFLSKALGEDAVAPCTYRFPSTDPASFVGLAAVLEGVGVSAYLGAASAITNKYYLTYAGSILTVEARHSAYLRAAIKEAPFARPFDKLFSWLSLKPFPTIDLATKGIIKSGDDIVFTTPGYVLAPPPGQKVYAAFLVVAGPIFVEAIRIEDNENGSRYKVNVPAGINGQSYAVLTSCNEYVNDDVIAAGHVILEITNKNVYGIS